MPTAFAHLLQILLLIVILILYYYLYTDSSDARSPFVLRLYPPRLTNGFTNRPTDRPADRRIYRPTGRPIPFLVQFDLRNLLVVNPHQIDEDTLAANTEDYLKGQAQAAMQSLVNRWVRTPRIVCCLLFFPATFAFYFSLQLLYSCTRASFRLSLSPSLYLYIYTQYIVLVVKLEPSTQAAPWLFFFSRCDHGCTTLFNRSISSSSFRQNCTTVLLFGSRCFLTNGLLLLIVWPFFFFSSEFDKIVISSSRCSPKKLFLLILKKKSQICSCRCFRLLTLIV